MKKSRINKERIYDSMLNTINYNVSVLGEESENFIPKTALKDELDLTAKLAVSNVFSQPQQVPNATLPQHATNKLQVETMFEMFKRELRGYNLAMPDLTGKEHLGNGVFRLYDDHGITIDYNVYNGVNEINGTATSTVAYNFIRFPDTLDEYRTLSVRYVSGIVVSGNNEIGILNNGVGSGVAIRNDNYLTPLLSQSKNNVNQLLIYIESGAVLTNYKFKIQLEKGTEATPYTVPGQIPQYKIVGEE